MEEVMRDLAPAPLVNAIEANGAQFLLALGRAGGAEERDDEWVQWTIGGSPIDYHNSVVRADLTEASADDVIVASMERMRTHGVPGTWHVGPSMRPADLPERLVRHGFTCGGHDIGMAVDLLALPDRVPAAMGLTATRVRDDAGLDLWTATLGRGFGEGEREASWVGAMYARIGLDNRSWRHYLAMLHGEPVGTTSLFLGAGVAGIYFVFTIPVARRQGIGAAITLAALHDARALGFRVGVLGSSPMGYSVYGRLGFRELCRIGIYEWRPPNSPATATQLSTA